MYGKEGMSLDKKEIIRYDDFSGKSIPPENIGSKRREK
jgi:hypothetical protein